MKVYVSNQQLVLPISKNSVKKAVAAILSLEGITCNEVGVHFVDSIKICELHYIYFNDPSITDCISFPILQTDHDFINLGDIFICPEVAQQYAVKYEGNPYTETTLYLIHGLLHLIGYDDMEKGKRISMRAAERRHMKNLQLNHLLLIP